MKKLNNIINVRKVRDKTKNERAITLVALAVSIIVLLVLAGVAISLSIGNNGIISRGEISAEGNKLASYKEKLEMYKAEKIMENEDFLAGTLSAGTDYLQYNTKKAEEKGTIKTIIPEFEDKYLGKLEVIKGELYLTSTDKKEIQAAKIAGIEFNPYHITEDGELQSSNTNLELMSPDGTLTIPSNVTKIGYGAFSNVEGLKTIIIPGTCKIIGEKAFANNKTLEKVIIQDGVEIIDNHAFRNCRSLASVEMANSVTKINTQCFYGDSNLLSINLSDNLNYIGPWAFVGCKIKEIEIPNGIEKLSGNPFNNYLQITTLNIPSSVNTISPGAINENITEINIAEENEKYETYKDGIYEKVNKVREKLVKYYGKDTNITVENGIKILGENCFKGKGISNITLPETLERIERYAFNYTKLENLSLSENIQKLDSLFLYGSNITKLTINENNPNYTVEDDILYNKDKTELILPIKPLGTITEFEIPNGVNKIGENAFLTQNKMTKVIIPETVKEIKQNAFGSCSSLTKIEIPSSVEKIGYGCFDSCKNLSEIRINKEKGSIAGSPWGADKGDRVAIWLK